MANLRSLTPDPLPGTAPGIGQCRQRRHEDDGTDAGRYARLTEIEVRAIRDGMQTASPAWPDNRGPVLGRGPGQDQPRLGHART